MGTPSTGAPSHAPSAIWFKIGAVLLVMVQAILFYILASRSLHRRLYDEVPAGGFMPGQPGKVIRH
jgi:hypothetical protein